MTAGVGTKLYAPQARLVDLQSGTVIGATTTTSGGVSAPAIGADIVSVRVTLTNTGIGQLQLTLNNQRSVGGLPVFPPWKYNDFSTARPRVDPSTGIAAIGFGQKLRLDLRYGDGPWIKMIIAQVTDLQFNFPASGSAQMQVMGEDLLSLLKVKPERDKNYERQQEEEIAEQIWNHVFTAAEQRPTFTTVSGAREREGRNQPLGSVRHAKSMTYFQFLQDIADRLDYEMHVEFKNSAAAGDASVGQAASATAQSDLQFFFEPARSSNPPVATPQDGLDQADGEFHYVLRWGRSLMEFTPKFKVFDQPSRAEAQGTVVGRRGRSSQQLSDSETNDLFTRELPLSPNYGTLSMKSALQARQDYFEQLGVSGENNESSSGSNLDEPRLKRKAVAAFLKRAREFMTAEAQVIGLPKLRPGMHVDVVGFRPPFDGYYYVTKTVHSLDASGYKTQLSLRRPGMLPPQNYLDLPASAGAEATS